MNDQEKNYGGIGRITFLGIFLGFPALIGGFAAILVPVSKEVTSLLPILFIVSFAIVMVIAAALRTKNTGYSQWWTVLILVPGLNFIFFYLCLFLPEGYAKTRLLDRAGTIGLATVLVLFAIGLVMGVLQGIKDRQEKISLEATDDVEIMRGVTREELENFSKYM